MISRLIRSPIFCNVRQVGSFKRAYSIASTSAVQSVLFSSISPEERGHAILLSQDTLPPGSQKTPHDLLSKAVFGAKILSLSSSVAGVVMVPVLSNYLWEAASERPTMMLFAIVANTFLVALSFTPLLLNVLTKRFPIQIYYNHTSKKFTLVYYSFFLRKHAIQFTKNQVQDGQNAEAIKKLWIPLATCFVNGRPLLVSLDRNSYIDKLAFDALTENVHIPPNHD